MPGALAPGMPLPESTTIFILRSSLQSLAMRRVYSARMAIAADGNRLLAQPHGLAAEGAAEVLGKAFIDGAANDAANVISLEDRWIGLHGSPPGPPIVGSARLTLVTCRSIGRMPASGTGPKTASTGRRAAYHRAMDLSLDIGNGGGVGERDPRWDAVLQSPDAPFDGRLFVGVTSTGVYCRPVCRVRTPRRENCRFYANAASAEAHGFRPCLRCPPE